MRNWWKIVLAGLAALVLLAVVALVFFGIFMFRGGFIRHPLVMGPGMMRGYFPGGYGLFGIFGMLAGLALPLLLLGLIVAGAFAIGRGMRDRPLPDAPVPSHACPNCGRAVQMGWVACPYCGQKLNESPEAAS
ncbi:MAG: zinc ribbon domain-containing protein [Omnitrophica WOR_2 bacterium]